MGKKQTTKAEQRRHAVVVCSIIKAKNSIHLAREVKHKLGERVFYAPKGGKKVLSGEIVRIVADIAISVPGSKQTLTYTIKTDNKVTPDIPYNNVYSDRVEAKLATEGLYKHECVIQVDNACFFDTIYAKDWNDAFDALKKKYPGATGVESLTMCL